MKQKFAIKNVFFNKAFIENCPQGPISKKCRLRHIFANWMQLSQITNYINKQKIQRHKTSDHTGVSSVITHQSYLL